MSPESRGSGTSLNIRTWTETVEEWAVVDFLTPLDDEFAIGNESHRGS